MFNESLPTPRYYFHSIDLSDARKIFVVGDIHGCFSLLESKLSSIGFDQWADHLISVGDLVDRGPESDQSVHYMNEPWFHNVLGNHEVMPSEDPYLHILNGGTWIQKFDEPDQMYYRRELLKAPLALEIIHPNGKRYGFTHAGFPQDDDGIRDWNEAKRLNTEQMTLYRSQGFVHDCLWNRDELRMKMHQSKNGRDSSIGVLNIEHVYHGHTPLKEPFTYANQTWLDTGAFATGILTVLEIK